MTRTHRLGKLINSILRTTGFELHRNSAWERLHRATYPGGLEHVKQLGFIPGTIFDVGVAKGTPALYEAFPDAHFILIDPLQESKPYMEKIVRRLSRAEYIIAAASAKPGRMTINAHADMNRTSMYWESDYDPADVTPREVTTITLDQIKREKHLSTPFFLKIDVQGGELDVLAGATEVLRDTECILLETSLFEFFRGAPLIADVVTRMNQYGFVIYDVWALQYRPYDGALTMLDLAFVKKDGRFRNMHRFRPEKADGASKKS